MPEYFRGREKLEPDSSYPVSVGATGNGANAKPTGKLPSLYMALSLREQTRAQLSSDFPFWE